VNREEFLESMNELKKNLKILTHAGFTFKIVEFPDNEETPENRSRWATKEW